MNVNITKLTALVCIFLFRSTAVYAQLMVNVSPPTVTGSKVLVKLELKNTFTEKIESARAVCFLLDENGKVVGQSTQWVIGGTKSRPPLSNGATKAFHFVIPTKPSTTTNLAARVSFTRVALEGGKLADVRSAVTIESTGK
jgi:hypothetical protein